MSLVELESLLPNAIFDLRYASTNNITSTVLYKNQSAKLLESAAKSLQQAADLLAQKGYRIVIWDAYRPVDVQKKLLAINSDPKYVLDAESSNHTKGLAIDLTLADERGNYLDMGTDFDDFTEQAHSANSGLNDNQTANRQTLKSVMEEVGFRQWPYEWWHFDFDLSRSG